MDEGYKRVGVYGTDSLSLHLTLKVLTKHFKTTRLIHTKLDPYIIFKILIP